MILLFLNLIKEQIETMMNELNMNVPITELQKVVKGVRNERLVIEDGKKKIEKYTPRKATGGLGGKEII